MSCLLSQTRIHSISVVAVTVELGADQVLVRWLVENVPLNDEAVETRIEEEGGSDTCGGVVMWSCECVVESSWEENDVRHHLLVWNPLNSTCRALLNHCLGRGPVINYLHTRTTAVVVPGRAQHQIQ